MFLTKLLQNQRTKVKIVFPGLKVYNRYCLKLLVHTWNLIRKWGIEIGTDFFIFAGKQITIHKFRNLSGHVSWLKYFKIIMMYPNCGLNELLLQMYLQSESKLISELLNHSRWTFQSQTVLRTLWPINYFYHNK